MRGEELRRLRPQCTHSEYTFTSCTYVVHFIRSQSRESVWRHFAARIASVHNLFTLTTLRCPLLLLLLRLSRAYRRLMTIIDAFSFLIDMRLDMFLITKIHLYEILHFIYFQNLLKFQKSFHKLYTFFECIFAPEGQGSNRGPHMTLFPISETAKTRT